VSSFADQLNPKRWTWRQWCLAVSVLVAAVVIFLYTPTPNLPELKLQGNGLVTLLQKYQTDHGTYPKALEEIGVEPPQTKWGPWLYYVTDDGLAVLKLGEYDKDGFTLYWQSDSGWQTDD